MWNIFSILFLKQNYKLNYKRVMDLIIFMSRTVYRAKFKKDKAEKTWHWPVLPGTDIPGFRFCGWFLLFLFVVDGLDALT